jgi:hypothetical protein
MPWSLVAAYQRFYLPVAYWAYSSTLKIEAVRSSETSDDYMASHPLTVPWSAHKTVSEWNSSNNRKRVYSRFIQFTYTGCENRSEIYRARIVNRSRINSPRTKRQITFNNFMFALLSDVYLTGQSGTRILFVCNLSRCIKTLSHRAETE